MHENILTLYSTQLSIPQSHADVTRPTYVTYTIPTSATGKEDQLIVSERKSLLSADGHTGSRTWEAALALGEYFLSNETSLAKPVSECRILELGAGTAFTSILLAKLKARRVLATDGSEAVCEAIRTNLELNGLGESDSITVPSRGVVPWDVGLTGTGTSCKIDILGRNIWHYANWRCCI